MTSGGSIGWRPLGADRGEPIPWRPASSQTIAAASEERPRHGRVSDAGAAAGSRRRRRRRAAIVSAMASTGVGRRVRHHQHRAQRRIAAATAARIPVISRGAAGIARGRRPRRPSGPPPSRRTPTPPMSGRTRLRADVRRRIAAVARAHGQRHHDDPDPGDHERDAAHDDDQRRGGGRLAEVGGARAGAAAAGSGGRGGSNRSSVRHRRRIVRGTIGRCSTAYTRPPMPFELPVDPRTERRTRFTRWVSFVIAALLVVLVAYFALRRLRGVAPARPTPRPTATDCRTPASMGWTYEAINYDDRHRCRARGRGRSDGLLEPGRPPPATPSPSRARSGSPAGRSPPDPVLGPTGPTVVMAHGWSSNKSAMLDRAAILHDALQPAHLRLPQPRTERGGRDDAGRPRGRRPARDARLARGDEGARSRSRSSASRWAARPPSTRPTGTIAIDAVIVESTHATLANAVQARLDASGYPLSLPGQLGDPARHADAHRRGRELGADPVQAIARLDERPVLIVTGGQDDVDRRRMTPRTSSRPPSRGRLAGRARRSAPRPAMPSRPRPARRTTPAGC